MILLRPGTSYETETETLIEFDFQNHVRITGTALLCCMDELIASEKAWLPEIAAGHE